MLPLRQQGFVVEPKSWLACCARLDYSCQANRKTREGTQHPDRNAGVPVHQCQGEAALAAGQPAISVDTKKKELVVNVGIDADTAAFAVDIVAGGSGSAGPLSPTLVGGDVVDPIGRDLPQSLDFEVVDADRLEARPCGAALDRRFRSCRR